MKLRNYLFVLAGVCMAGSLSAQITFTTRQFFPNGVNNDGVVVGHKDQVTPQELWYPSTNQFETIGGISAGNGLGGVARFSGDGTKISSTMKSDKVPVPAKFGLTNMFDYSKYTFNQSNFRGGVNSKNIYAIGSTADGNEGIILHSSNSGQTWRDAGEGTAFTGGLVSMGALNYSKVLIGGHNGALYNTHNDGGSWEEYTVRPKGNTKEVDTYWAMDFIQREDAYPADYGVIGLEYKDKTYGVWQTEDSGDTMNEATGVSGIPVRICHFVDTYYMVTRNGHIQKSIDYGKTWTDLYATTSDAPLYGIKFVDEQTGMALGKGDVYVTTDAGENWTKKTVAAGVTDNVTWNDVLWKDGTVIIVGSSSSVYETKDKGETWSKVEVKDAKADANLLSIDANKDAVSICGSLGTFYWKSNHDFINAATAGVYDMATQSWTPLETLGYASDECYANAYNISGNGEIVIGTVSTFKVYNESSSVHGHAALWDKDGKILDLGSKFADRNRTTRATACSYDGSVIVGHQDIWGPWFACVWRKNTDGSYTQKMMLKYPNTKEEDVDWGLTQAAHDDMTANCLGMCGAMTSDGKWIGGRGEPNTATMSPWIWSEESGLILLDPTNQYSGMVAAMNSDASVVVGDTWIWLKEEGKTQNLNDYVTKVLGGDLKGHGICGVYDMSPNGRYIAGWCMKGDGKYGYIVDLQPTSNVESVAVEQCRASIYPNPVSDVLHVDFPYEDVKTNVRLLNTQGMTVKQMSTLAVSNTMELNDVPAGLYILDVEAEGVHKTFKVEVVH